MNTFNFYDALRDLIAKMETDEFKSPYSVVGDTIMAEDEKSADMLANFIEKFGYDIGTGYYDPEEDKRDNKVDECTGLWYVDVV